MSEGMSDWQVWLYVAAVLIPLGAFAVEFLFGRVLGHLNAYFATVAIGLSCLLSLVGLASYVTSDPQVLAQHKAEGPEAEHVGPEAAHGPLVWRGRFDWVALGEGLSAKGAAFRSQTPALKIPIVIYIDNLAVIMFAMVTFIATLIHVYSIGYMHGDPRYHQFFSFLSLFCFSMLGLVASGTIFMVFMFWELVGVCSYLLIGFWYQDKKNADAANKAFIVNRVGDVGMLLGLGLLWAYLGTFTIEEINKGLRDPSGRLHRAAGDETVVELHDLGPGGGKPVADPASGQTRQIPLWVLGLAGLGVFAGCMGKSAQFPLHVWLPDAMAGPTPVSALIHAATMVAAGVYLTGRFFPLFTPEVLLVIAYIGGITLFIAASIAMVQTDYKKVLAYSTVSQLGFMMTALGVGGWAAGLFHLLTHAFFKALLFLGAGSIYHAVHTYEMPVLGGLRHKMKITAYTMLVGTLAISGVPFFSGFYSKDAILASALHFVFFREQNLGHILLFLLPAVGAVMTAFYMFRMWFLVFAGEPRGFPAAHMKEAHGDEPVDPHHGHDSNPAAHAHESGWVMTAPLIILAAFSVFVGWPITFGIPFLGYEPVLEGMLAYGEPLPALNVEGARWWAFGASVLIMAAGVGAGVLYYAPSPRWRRLDPRRASEAFRPVYDFLAHKWYFDELYHAIFVRPALWLAGAASLFDRRGIDAVVDGSARVTVMLSQIGGLFDQFGIDRAVNGVARITYVVGDWSRVLQTGRLRNYLMFLALAVVVLSAGVFAWIR